MGGDTQTYAQTDTQTYTHINTMTRPGLGAGPSEEEKNVFYIREKETTPISFQLSVTSGHPMLPLLTAYLPLFLRYNTPLHNIELYYQTMYPALSCLLQSSLASKEELAGMSEPDMKSLLVEGLSLTLNPEVHSV